MTDSAAITKIPPPLPVPQTQDYTQPRKKYTMQNILVISKEKKADTLLSADVLCEQPKIMRVYEEKKRIRFHTHTHTHSLHALKDH